MMKNQVHLPESAEYKMEADITEEIVEKEVKKFRKKLSEKPDTYPKDITIKFRGESDANDFCRLVHSDIDYSQTAFFHKADRERVDNDYKFIGNAPKRKERNRDQSWRELWTDMPSFIQEESTWIYHKIKVVCETRDDYVDLAHILRQFLTLSTSTTYHPSWSASNLKQFVWSSSLPKINTDPKYPVFIVSKGRAFSRYTSKALEEMNVPYYIVVEPKEYETYAAVIDPDKVLTLPYDSDPDNPTGPGRARNWCWDYAKQVLKARRHWVMDDNLEAFYRLHENKRYRISDGAIFRAMEDFVDRFENVMVAGPNYRFFAAPKSELPAYVANTRIYSCLLIDNDCPHRWRERYNEDTILALDVLSDENEFATIQFNAFLQGKMGTQVLKGGNTEVFYHAEGEDFDENYYNATGTVRKSVNLQLMYPDITKVVTRANRVHHEVDYSGFKNNQLKLKKDFYKPSDCEYGMKLINRYK